MKTLTFSLLACVTLGISTAKAQMEMAPMMTLIKVVATTKAKPTELKRFITTPAGQIGGRKEEAARKWIKDDTARTDSANFFMNRSNDRYHRDDIEGFNYELRKEINNVRCKDLKTPLRKLELHNNFLLEFVMEEDKESYLNLSYVVVIHKDGKQYSSFDEALTIKSATEDDVRVEVYNAIKNYFERATEEVNRAKMVCESRNLIQAPEIDQSARGRSKGPLASKPAPSGASGTTM